MRGSTRPTYVSFQRVLLTVEVSIAPGSAGDGLTPLSIEIDALDGLEVGAAHWPSSRRFTRPGFNDGRWVHEGVVRSTVPLTFAAAPGGGDHLVGVTVRYQACDDASCLVPASVQLQVPVREAALVGRSLPSPTPKS